MLILRGKLDFQSKISYFDHLMAIMSNIFMSAIPYGFWVNLISTRYLSSKRVEPKNRMPRRDFFLEFFFICQDESNELKSGEKPPSWSGSDKCK